jgi:shikimate dehydrogenase
MISPKRYGLVGKKLDHSFSKKFFEAFFLRNKIENVVYENYELERIEDADELLKNEELQGINITIPYKEEIMRYMDELDPESEKVGAVNCAKKIEKGWKGYNTDIAGFRESLKPLLNTRHKNALVFGSGGASKAVIFVLNDLKIAFTLVSTSGIAGSISYESVTPELIHKTFLLINCTPLGTFPDIESSVNIPYHAIGRKHLLYDLVYNPLKSDFLKSGEAMGATIKNGLEMLEIQALESWKIWQSAEN